MYNRAIMVGRLVSDPDIRITPNGDKVATIRIAVDRAYSKDKKADFFTVVGWKQKADFLERFFNKGSAIGVEGEVHNREYEKNGEKRYATEIAADRLFFVGRSDTSKADTLPDEGWNPAADDSQDLPF